MTAIQNVHFDREYFSPHAMEVKMFNKDDWKLDETMPQWLGFSYEGKPYKLEEVPSENHPGLWSIKEEKVFNPYLERAFELKTSQYDQSHPDFKLVDVYHGTVAGFVPSILENNFNWRYAGQRTGFWHGKGVNFTHDKVFAGSFCKGFDNRIIKARIPILYLCWGQTQEGDDLPPKGCDTACTTRLKVLVKFEDSEFLPLYVTHFN